MSSKSETTRPQTFVIPHYRGRDFREHQAHAYMFRIDGEHAILTFFREDTVIKAEQLELRVDEATGVESYVTTGVDQDHVREDVCSVRIPLNNFLMAAQAMVSDLTPRTEEEGEENANAS